MNPKPLTLPQPSTFQHMNRLTFSPDKPHKTPDLMSTLDFIIATDNLQLVCAVIKQEFNNKVRVTHTLARTRAHTHTLVTPDNQNQKSEPSH